MSYRFDEANHVHLLDGKPLIGCSTAKSIIGKGDALINWAANCAVDYIKDNGIPTALTHIKKHPSVVVPLEVLDAARKAHTRKKNEAAKVGTARHGQLEEWIRGCIDEHEGVPVNDYAFDGDDPLLPFKAWCVENVARFIFTEANCYSRELWAGGIADLGLELKDGRRLVGDHKSSKAAYFDQFIQTAIYDVLLSENGGHDAEGKHLFDWKQADGYIIFPFRSAPFTPEVRWDAEELRAAAESIVRLYKLSEYVTPMRM